ncbi:MAG: hypothetical protein ACMUIP_09135 [bacterium]
MKKLSVMLMLTFLMSSPFSALARPRSSNSMYSIKNTIAHDYSDFYSRGNSIKLMAGIALAGLLANTTVDNEIQNVYQTSYKNKNTDTFSKATKQFGEGKLALPAYLGIAFIGELTKNTQLDSTAGEWSRRSLRSITVGAPTLLLLQRALGASRPKETDSHWRPFNDDNAVSGHSFMGAIPFLSAAHMTENRFLQLSLYLGSTLTGFSRINDDNHYFSQAALGWWMAHLASECETSTGNDDVVITPGVIQSNVGLIMIFHF